MKKTSATRVAVIMGGDSAEREISLKTGLEVVKGLKASGFIVKSYDLRDDLEAFFVALKKGKHDVVFNALHGPGGEDGRIQGMLDLLKVPYTGSGVLASALAMDKVRAKEVYRANQLPVAKELVITRALWKDNKQNVLRRKIKFIGDAIVLKPIDDGSSVDVTVNPPKASWETLITKLLRKYERVLVEEYIEGRELTVGVLGHSALPVVEIRTKRGTFSYEAKYQDKETEKLCPAPIHPKHTRQAQSLALKAHESLGCQSYSRTDMMLHPKKGLILLETNTLPGLTPMSLLPREAKVAGISFEQLVTFLVRDAMKK